MDLGNSDWRFCGMILALGLDMELGLGFVDLLALSWCLGDEGMNVLGAGEFCWVHHCIASGCIALYSIASHSVASIQHV